MQEIGGCAYLLGQMLNQAFGILDAFGKLVRIFLSILREPRKAHAQRSQRLPRTVVQFACYVAPLHILRLQELPRKLTQFRVSSLKFAGTELHLGVECICQCSITFFAFTQLSFNSFTLGDVSSNFRRPDNLAAAVPKRRNCERNIERCLVLPNTNGVEVFDSFASLDSIDDDSLFVPAIEGDDQRNMLGYRFAGGVAKQPLRTRVPTGYDPVQRFAHDGIVR